ncbi:rod shape-determining protein MreC [Piscinibacter koreensis]|uniref:Cell shape-determining protein MreC n=1 Tax=Piscinibacter koreensis TaxID=2742824 RepID=A0A7Y6TV16_9BURK|nr:rod shape-determining protein MreC [Schlegelella koreensis]NUZ04442.1 rod shape-determining protein MreC [Schlegelella koreensis]
MALATIDRTPPPFFRQGPSALTKLSICSMLALFLMVADTHLAITQPLRALVAAALYPAQRVLLVPVEAVRDGREYVEGLQRAVEGAEQARAELARQSERALRVEHLMQENARLRALLELRPSLEVRSQAAQVLYEAVDPYSRKVIIDRGSAHAITAGSPVINEAGVLGQVTRVYLQSAEVTLLTDRDAAIPVLNARTQLRGAAFGGASGRSGGLELRFMAGNADVQVGDVMTTSGVDGVYPPGLPVAKVAAIDRKQDAGFARITLTPAAASEGVRHVLVLEPLGLQLPPRPDVAPVPAPAGRAASRPGVAASRPGARR